MSTSSSSKPPPAPRPSRLKNALKNFALFGFTLLLCVALTELALRIMGYGNVEIYEPHPLLYWRLKPNQECYTKIDRKPVRVNMHGTRGREFTAIKPAGTLRIVSLGDSRTFGWGLSEAETYSGLLEKKLQDHLAPARKVEVINCGVNAWSYPQMNVFFREFALKWQPDMVILADANLWTQFSEQNDPVFVKKFLTRVRLKNFLRRFALYHYVVEVQLKNFYERHRTKFVPVDPKQDTLFREQQQKDPDAFFRSAIETLCATARSNGIPVVVLYQPNQIHLLTTNTPTDGVLRAKQQVSREFNVPFLDLTEDLRPQAKDLYLDADPVHLNAVGNEIIGRRLFEVVSPLLKP
jgi:lysophospholipase L1-like esterase